MSTRGKGGGVDAAAHGAVALCAGALPPRPLGAVLGLTLGCAAGRQRRGRRLRGPGWSQVAAAATAGAWTRLERPQRRPARLVQAIALQQRPGRGPFVDLVERQRMQEMFGGRRRALGKSFQEDQRPLRPLVEQRRRGGQHKNDSIAGARLDRLLRERQETRMEVRISEGREQPFRPDVGLVRRLREQVGLTQC